MICKKKGFVINEINFEQEKKRTEEIVLFLPVTLWPWRIWDI